MMAIEEGIMMKRTWRGKGRQRGRTRRQLWWKHVSEYCPRRLKEWSR